MSSHEPLERDRVTAGLSPQARSLLSELVLQGEVDSTNTEAMRRLEVGAGSGLVVAAEQQTSGRGRHGRRWVSPFGANMYLSLAWNFERGIGAMAGLSLAVGVAVAEALAEHGLEEAELKWPNDILHRGAKLGGILVETSGHAAGPVSAVVGIGINLRMPAEVAATIDQPWTDAERALGVPIGRNGLLASLLNRLLPLLGAYEIEGFHSWRERWLERNAHTGQRVTLTSGDRRVAGVVAGVDPSGALLLDVGGTVQPFSGGELSLRADR